MLQIGEAQMLAMAAEARRHRPAVLAGYCERAGMAPADARGLAGHVLEVSAMRGLDTLEEQEALADVFRHAGPGAEPPWCLEITTSPAPHKADRLRACLRAVTGG